ncbi:alpha/beta hydrolase [Methanocorpusculum vombati]|uniref:Alpha/beta fold hydrolase n=1 Tax=Methanocorpusculum vombati TaxID=3002864 RepID=A0ABT4IL73_9EURY|nr:alpha/beta hydrolase [Methanocorpusculum vombati]MCZ9318777.1 alpha/beta fold hydrolase [Methanocorpusculum sp.]MCZ0862514.1 alpha/beta fold hydrolase [Methanocorpusculum vombati]MDE2521419.1 alpha/beta fold hydrolase [Methanocorpusculum sp.]MDE2533905.1 alpha/beta fold hydrolase [Methanocorpusculum sp.]MDE2546760.1 alpha/beta fold hydrolase [Methanocorpusculum sp.]
MRYVHSPFQSDGLWCDGDLYLPDNVDKPPVLIFVHGLGYPRFAGLMPFICPLLTAGIAVYTFDFRNLTFSEGVLRNLIDPGEQVRDLHAAITHMRALPEVDGERIGLCGVSVSAGHTMITAAEDHQLAGIGCFIPCMDPKSYVLGRGVRFFLPLYLISLLDDISSHLGLSPICIPMKLPVYLFADCESPDFYPGYQIAWKRTGRKFGYDVLTLSLQQRATGKHIVWTNLFPARSILRVLQFQPQIAVPDVQCPALIIAARDDSIVPYASVQSMAERFPEAELVSYEGDHFELGNHKELKEVVVDFFFRKFSENR